MANINIDSITPSNAVHPGIILKEALDNCGMSQKELADAVGKSTPVINDIIKGKRGVNAELAVLLESVLGVKAEEWMNYQSQYDLNRARSNGEIERRKNVISDWQRIKPLLKMAKLKKAITLTGDLFSDVHCIYEYAGVSNIDDFEHMFSQKESMFRKSDKVQVDMQNLFTWILIVRHLSNATNIATPFDKDRIPELIDKLNDLFYINKDMELHIPDLLSSFGIKYVQQEHFEKVPVDGYSFWNGENPTLVLTKRYNRIDNFAYTLMHELGHISLHLSADRNADFLDMEDTDINKGREEEADRFARKHLSRGLNLDGYFARWRNPYAAGNFLKSLSEQTHINVSIITGLYQHFCQSYTICRNLLEKVQ